MPFVLNTETHTKQRTNKSVSLYYYIFMRTTCHKQNQIEAHKILKLLFDKRLSRIAYKQKQLN